jgi:hypothetical protein
MGEGALMRPARLTGALLEQMNEFATISVRYRLIDGYHVFTSDDVRGLYVANQDPEQAFDACSEVLSALLTYKFGIEIEVTPAATIEEFMRKIRAETAVIPPAYQNRNFIIRQKAA